jgi:hypothetical protein
LKELPLPSVTFPDNFFAGVLFRLGVTARFFFLLALVAAFFTGLFFARAGDFARLLDFFFAGVAFFFGAGDLLFFLAAAFFFGAGDLLFFLAAAFFFGAGDLLFFLAAAFFFGAGDLLFFLAAGDFPIFLEGALAFFFGFGDLLFTVERRVDTIFLRQLN